VQVLTFAPSSRAASLSRLAASLTPSQRASVEEAQGGQLASAGGGG
jgi:hypothetical protein